MAKAVKWGIGGDEPEDLEDFKTNDEIGKPPKGVYNFRIVKLERTEIKNGENAGTPRIRITAAIEEKDKDKKRWNGYTIWDGLNFIEGYPKQLIKAFLSALGLTWSDLMSKTKENDEVEPPQIVRIGAVNFLGKPVFARATTKDSEDQEGNPRLEIGRWLALQERTDEEDEAYDEAADEAEEDDVDDQIETDAAGDDEEPWTREELEDEDEFSLEELKKEAVAAGVPEAKVKKLRKRATVIDLILEAQGEDEDEDEDDDEGDEDEEIDLDSLTDDELKAKAKELGAGPRDLRKAKTHAALVELVEELQDEEGEEDGEPPF